MLNYEGYESILLFALACGAMNAKPHWSEWSNCPDTDVCTRRRILECDEGEGIECIPRNTMRHFEEQLTGCSSSLCESGRNLSLHQVRICKYFHSVYMAVLYSLMTLE